MENWPIVGGKCVELLKYVIYQFYENHRVEEKQSEAIVCVDVCELKYSYNEKSATGSGVGCLNWNLKEHWEVEEHKHFNICDRPWRKGPYL